MSEKPLVPYKSLKQKQKARIADWMYRETLRFFLEHQRMPEAEESPKTSAKAEKEKA